MTMLENINYNLVQTIAIISQSLYRYDTYIQDAAGCPSCQEIWRKFKKHRIVIPFPQMDLYIREMQN